MYAIEIKDLVKNYNGFLAVDNISLKIKRGEIYGLLGPNGAGKSTTINILSGLLKQTSGEIKINGVDVSKSMKGQNKVLGLVPQDIALYKSFTAEENLKFFGELYGLRGKKLKERVESALEFTGLTDVRKKISKEFSGGMLRRLNIACALVHRPEILIMDEPTVGIDPQSRNHILNSVRELNKKGVTIIYTTHYMEEVEAICTEIGIIDHGKLIVNGTKEELKNLVCDKKKLIVSLQDIKSLDINTILNINGVVDVDFCENEIIISSNKEANNLEDIIKTLNSLNSEIINIKYEEVNLEQVFLTLTGRTLRE
ncbi:MAG: ABC transporter ATP-binding protein [Clostridium chrysemydis]|uniref:ABC transporter ATP-binding protein n=1 Tax=Clostridium TaxID=1485 RepID=UPI00215259E0|nr:ABC transporter ATP-binding protein [Clostridium sp. LY3-2]MCR6514101.1 ABC transporter ATP-binding protein [Clostridium sp. LY3-2]